MNARRQIRTDHQAPADAVARCRDAIFRALNKRAADLAASDDITPAQSIAASASAMIADALTRLTPVEPEPEPAFTLRLVGGFDDADPDLDADLDADLDDDLAVG